MKIHVGLPPGVTALMFDAARARRALEARLCRRLDDAGFSEVLLPILDYFDPYESLLDQRSRERLYRFVDRDGQLLALRGDFTPMLARLLAPRLESLELPLRLFYRGDVVRYQEVRPGKMREYSELGAELLDSPDRDNDETVLALFVELLGSELAAPRGAATRLRVVVGLAGALDELVLGLGGDAGVLAAVARRDRRAAREFSRHLLEIVEDGRPAELETLGVACHTVGKLVELCAKIESRYGDRGVRVEVDLAEFAPLVRTPALLGPGVERSYYDGIAFRAYLEGDAEPVGAGGRYDGLFGALGAAVGATGFSVGLDRLKERPR